MSFQILHKMTVTCKNCDKQFEGHYCSNCGQSSKTEQLSFHFLVHEIQHALVHLDKGFLYTARELFTRPGHTVREFIEGKRVKHFKPFSLVIVLTTILAILYHYFNIDFFQGRGFNNDPQTTGITPQKINEWLLNHFSLTTFIFLLFSSIASYLVFKKYKYLFVEHLVINAFLSGQHLLVHLVLFPVIYLSNGTPYFTLVSALLNLINLMFSIWLFVQFFHTHSKIRIFFLSLGAYFLAIIFVMISAVIVGNILNQIMNVIKS
jgi:hypothetical protein